MDLEPKQSEQDRIREIRRICGEYLEPLASAMDRSADFPLETLKLLGEFGFLGLQVPEEYKGCFSGDAYYYSVIEAMAETSPAHALTVISHSLCCRLIRDFGTDSQKAAYLSGLATGRIMGAVCMTEAGAGSDLNSIRTRAVKRKNRYVIDGRKLFITNGGFADVFVVLASTSDQDGPFTKSLFIVPKTSKGIRSGKKEMKLGFRGADTREVILDGVDVRSDLLLGREGNGLIQMARAMEGSRLAVAAMALGLAERSRRLALKSVRFQEKDGTSEAVLEGHRMLLAETATEIMCVRLLIKRAAEVQAEGKPVTDLAAMAKWFSAETAMRAASNTLQILAMTEDRHHREAERLFRDAKLCGIIEGTTEIQKKIVARFAFTGD